MQKKRVQLKEVLTEGSESARRAFVANIKKHPRNSARCPRKLKRAIVDVAGNACAAVVFANHAFDDHRTIDVVAISRWRRKARCADSDSRFLAIKNFSCSPALPLSRPP